MTQIGNSLQIFRTATVKDLDQRYVLMPAQVHTYTLPQYFLLHYLLEHALLVVASYFLLSNEGELATVMAKSICIVYLLYIQVKDCYFIHVLKLLHKEDRKSMIIFTHTCRYNLP